LGCKNCIKSVNLVNGKYSLQIYIFNFYIFSIVQMVEQIFTPYFCIKLIEINNLSSLKANGEFQKK